MPINRIPFLWCNTSLDGRSFYYISLDFLEFPLLMPKNWPWEHLEEEEEELQVGESDAFYSIRGWSMVIHSRLI